MAPRKPKKVKLKAPSNTEVDAFIGKSVLFPLFGDRADWLKEPRLQDHATIFDGKPYLAGNVSKKQTKQGSGPSYIVEWESTIIDKVKFSDASLLYEAVSLHQTVTKTTTSTSESADTRLLSRAARRSLYSFPDDEGGDMLSSDDSADDSEDEEEIILAAVDREGRRNALSSMTALMDELGFGDESPQTIEDAIDNGLTWKLNKKVSPPLNVSKGKKSRLKKDAKKHFSTPGSSLLAFLPLKFWKLWCFETNRYGKMKAKEKGSSFSPVSLKEFMKFFGILLKMTMFPMPGQSYPVYWAGTSDEGIPRHSYTMHMGLRRFSQIRGALHMVDNSSTTEGDALYKVRPLLTILKETVGAYVIVGSEAALDESSWACRSAYGRDFIFYNPSKNTGKYHFRFYCLCESDFYNVVRFKIHTRTNCDVGDGFDPQQLRSDGAGEDDEETHGAIHKLVLDMCSPFAQSGRVVNMDNYYSGPLVFIDLLKMNVYARGTVRQGRAMFPEAVTFSKSEAKKTKRGAMKMASCEEHKMVAMGWVDGNPVQLLSTADGTIESTVFRRVKGKKVKIASPSAIRNYNKGMQAVDRFDQLVSLYSMGKRHAFKKYYNKLSMALLDIGLTNAEQHYYMAGHEKKRHSRFVFRNELANFLLETDWNAYDQDLPQGMEGMFTSPAQDDTGTPSSVKCVNVGFQYAPTIDLCNSDDEVKLGTKCQPVSVLAYLKRNNENKAGRSYKGMVCQVCKFELRRNVTKDVSYCKQHGVRCCTVVRQNDKNSPVAEAIRVKEEMRWLCTSFNATCWQKAHQFYIPNGLWGKAPTLESDRLGCPRTKSFAIKSYLYKERVEWMIEKGLLSERPKKRGGKKKKAKATVAAALEEEETVIIQTEITHQEDETTITEDESFGTPNQVAVAPSVQPLRRSPRAKRVIQMADV